MVSAVNKKIVGTPEFRLTNLLKEDQWVRLKRCDSEHQGLIFTPVRKVLTVEE